MYLISIYFDKQTEKRLQNLINRVADATGNSFMIDNRVPPHITVAAVETRREDELITCIDGLVKHVVKRDVVVRDAVQGIEDTTKWIDAGDIQLVSVGTFLPQVIFVQPVLNAYLHNLSVLLSEELSSLEETICSQYYQPFGWLPHCTIGKQLIKEQMTEAYKVLQDHFVPINGRVTRIGVARTNPHRDIKVWELE